MGPIVIFGLQVASYCWEISWALCKHIMCSSLNTIFDWQQAEQTFKEQQAVCDTADYTNPQFKPALARQAGLFFSCFCPFSSPLVPLSFTHPSSFSFSLNLCRPASFDPTFFPSSLPLFLSLFLSPFSVQSWDKLNESPCNGGNTSFWQCSISQGAYFLTDWINVLCLVWEATCSGSEGYSQAHRSTH